MRKIWHVATREFTSTVLTKGFIFGMLVTPVMLALVVIVFPRLLTKAPPRIVGEIAVVDPTGQVAEGFRAYLQPERLAERRRAAQKQALDGAPQALQRTAESSPAGTAAMQQSLDAVLGEVPRLTVTPLDPEVNLEDAKAALTIEAARKRAGSSSRLAVVVIHPDAVRQAVGRAQFGTYDLYVRGKLDDRLIDEIAAGLREAIIDARVRASGLNRTEIEALTEVKRPQSRTVTAAGEQATNEILNTVFPAAFMVLLLMSVFTSGQALLTSTVEEKSNRVVEVLLSAVSATELMSGKILGQMAVGLIVLVLYLGLGIAALVSFAMLGLLDPMLLVYLFIFYLLAFFTVASFMAAVGAAVNEMREAQALMTPIMLVVMIPWILWLPISRDPNGALAVLLSFIPPVGDFVMLLRMTSASPPPLWQVWLSILVGAAGVIGAVWFAAKVFRIGLLMFGKPPSMGTLVRWARMS